MSMFGKFAVLAATESLAAAPTQEASAATEDAGFTAEREAASLNAEGETQESVPTTDRNTDLEEGEVNDGVTTKTSGDDVVVNADDTDAVFNNVAEDDVEDDKVFSDFDDDNADIEMLLGEITQLSAATMAVEDFGIDRGSMRIMQITGLLSSTALEHLGMESVHPSKPDEPEAVMALEALGDKLKEKAGALGAKVLSVVKNGAGAVMGVLNKLWTGVSGLVSKLTSKAWDATKAAGATIKAHPYRTIAAVVTAIAVTAGIVAAMGGIPSAAAKGDAMKNFVTKIASDINNKIKWPFGKMEAKVGDSLRLTFQGNTNATDVMGQMDSVKKLGWTQSSVKAIGDQLSRAWNAVKGGVTGMGDRAGKMVYEGVGKAGTAFINTGADFATGVGNLAAKATTKLGGSEKTMQKSRFVAETVSAGFWIGLVTAAVAGVYKTIKAVVVNGLRIIMATFRAIAGAVGLGGGEAAAEPAAA